MKSDDQLNVTHLQSKPAEYPYRYTSSLTGRPITVDRVLVPAYDDIYGACLSRGRATRCCGKREACLLYNDTFLRLKQVAQQKPGVYIVFRGHPTPANIVYIGQSNDLYSRIVAHNAGGNTVDKLRKATGAQMWCEVHIMDDAYERFYWEQKWIDEYSPAGNRMVLAPA